MKDREWKAKKKKVLGLFQQWISVMGLKWYEIDFEWMTGSGGDKGDGFVRNMCVKSRWEYRTATISIWLEEVPEDPDRLEKMIVHELCHIFVQITRPFNEDESNDQWLEREEYAVESLARAFIWVRNSSLATKNK